MTSTLTPIDLTTHDGYRALMRAVIQLPEEDTPRLVFADWLEEFGDSARAEFIRAQVELARCKDTQDPGCLRRHLSDAHGYVEKVGDSFRPIPCRACWEPLLARSDALLRVHEARWRRGGRCERCDHGWSGRVDSLGFSIRCPTCHGTGWRGPLAMLKGGEPWDKTRPFPWQYPVAWERGFIVQVDCNLRDAFTENGAVTDWARSVVEWEPVMRFGIVDRVPGDYTHEDGGESFTFTVRTENQYEVNHDLPRLVFDALKGGTRNRDNWMIRFPTPADANLALAEAVGTVVRDATGIGGER